MVVRLVVHQGVVVVVHLRTVGAYHKVARCLVNHQVEVVGSIQLEVLEAVLLEVVLLEVPVSIQVVHLAHLDPFYLRSSLAG